MFYAAENVEGAKAFEGQLVEGPRCVDIVEQEPYEVYLFHGWVRGAVLVNQLRL